MSLKDLCLHFGLHTPPFARNVPAPGLLRHRSFEEALSRLRLAVESRAPAVLTAEPGLGKSTLLGELDGLLDKGTTRVVYTPLSSCGPFGLVGQLAARYGVKPRRSGAQTAQALLDEIGRSNMNEVLILDEAHLLPRASLEELRLLGNTDFDRTPPFAMILAGQPPLREHLAEPDHVSLSQRLAIRASLSPLADRETVDYLERRLRAAGAQATLFRPAAADKVFERSRGVPRLINNLALGALFAAATAGRRHIDLKDVETAAFDMEHA